jgi:hypothetical protein
MDSKITNRIVMQTGMPQLFSTLAEELSPSDLQSLLLSVYKARVREAHERDVLARARQNSLFVPSSVDVRLLNKFDSLAFDVASQFDLVDLSPVCPLGTTSLLGGIDQNNLLTTIRNAEVLGDSTPAMALECARRRKASTDRQTRPVRLCASHRVVRLQPFDGPHLTPHFQLLTLVSAGRDVGSNLFEIQYLSEHIHFYLRLFRALNTEHFSLANPLVEISDLGVTELLLDAAGISRQTIRQTIRAHRPGDSERFFAAQGITLPKDITNPDLELKDLTERHGFRMQFSRLVQLKEQLIDPLQAEYAEARFRFNLARLEGLGYYTGLCVRISPIAPDGVRYSIVDGGMTNWTARLLQDNKERLLTTGIGSEFVCKQYRAATSP